MPNDPAIRQLLDDCASYAFRSYHAPPVRTGSAFDSIRIDRNLGMKKAGEYAGEKVKHDKVGMIKPMVSGVGQAAGIALTVASPGAGPLAPAVAGVGLGITATATVLDYVSDEVKFAYKSRKKNKSLEDKAYLLSEEGLSDLAHNYDKAVAALCEYWDAMAGPAPRSCVDAARLAFVYAKFEKRFMRLDSEVAAVYLRELARVIQQDCLRAFMFVRARKNELIELLRPHDAAVLAMFGAPTTDPLTNDGFLNWRDALPAPPGQTAGIRTAIAWGRRLGDRKKVYELVSKLKASGELPGIRKAARAAAIASDMLADATGIDADDPLGTAVGQVQDTVMNLVGNLATAAIESADLASAAVDAVNPLSGGPLNPQMAASVTGTVLEAVAIMADDYANWRRLAMPLKALGMPDPAARANLLDHRDRVWRARKLLESRLDPILGTRDWLDKGKASVTHALDRVRIAAAATGSSAAAAAAAVPSGSSAAVAAAAMPSASATPAAAAPPAAGGARPTGRGFASGPASSRLAASSESPTVEAISSLYFLQAKAFEMLRDSALIQFTSQLVTDGLAFMQTCRTRATGWTAPTSMSSIGAAYALTGDLDRRLDAVFNSAPCADGHTCYHPMAGAASYRPRRPLGS